jgi:hypothetical protein
VFEKLFCYGICLIFNCIGSLYDHICDLVVRVPGRYLRGPGFDSWRHQIFCVAVGLEQGPLSPVKINEELLERNVATPV